MSVRPDAWRYTVLLACLLVGLGLPEWRAPLRPLPAPSPSTAGASAQSSPSAATAGQVLARYGRLLLRFEPNQGQTDRSVRFLARGDGYTLFLTPTQGVLTLARRQAQSAVRQPCGDLAAVMAPAWRRQAGLHAPSGAVASLLCRVPADPVTAQALRVERSVLRWRFVSANPRPRIMGQDRLPGVSNYLIGRDPRAWHRALPGYAEVVYHALYPGVDLVYHGEQGGQVEYDLALAPGANLSRVRIAVEGTAGALRLDGAGNLVLPLGEGTLRQERPVVYQVLNGVRRPVAARYVLEGGNTVGFQVGRHDGRRPLVLDPVLLYSTYLGGSGGGAAGRGIALDGAGHAYITGFTLSHDFPTTAGAFSGTLGGAQDAFVAALDTSLTGTASLVYSTYLGGSGSDDGSGIAVDPTCTSGCHAYVTGTTSSSDFPTTTNAYSRTLAGAADAFVTELSTDGSTLLYSTFLGGTSSTIPGTGGRTGSSGIAVDAAGRAYVTGDTLAADFPTTTNAYSRTLTGVLAAFVTELDPALSGTASLAYSTLFGTNDTFGIAVRPGCMSGCLAAVAGTAFSDLPTTTNAYSDTSGCTTAFVSAFNPSASGPASLVYSSCLGGDDANGIAMDSAAHVYIVGDTSSSGFPTTTNAYSRTLAGFQDAFVSEVDTSISGTASLVYSTFFGGGVSIRAGGKSYNAVTTGHGVAVDGAGHIYLAGTTDTTDFPTTSNAYVRAPQVRIDNIFVSEIDPTAGTNGLLYSTYLSPYGSFDTDDASGVAVDPRCAAGCRAYVAGQVASGDFPTTPNAYARTLPSADGSAFLSTIDTGMSGTASLAYSTFLGGSGGANSATSIAVDGAGHAYVAGQAASADFPTTPNAYARTLAGPYGNAFVAELSPDGSSLLYSTYLGGSGNGSFGGDFANSIAVDAAGHAYVTGQTFSPDFPTTTTAYSRTLAGPNGNAFVSVLSADGSGLLYSTYLGGSGTYNQTSVFIGQSGSGICLSAAADCGDAGAGIAVDPGCTTTCHVYVTGSTYSADFPTTTNAYSRTLVSSSFEAFVAELDPALSGTASLRYSTYLGGNGGYPYTFEGDAGSSIAVDGSGHVYVTGLTYSTTFPTTSNAYTVTLHGFDGNAFVSEIDPSISGTAGLLYSTYLGGNGVSGPATWTFGDAGTGIALAPGCLSACRVYVAGYTFSTNFPTTTNAYSTTLSGSEDAFVSELDTTLSGTASLLYSTYLGGSGGNAAGGIAVDPAGHAFVTGSTFSTDFPTTTDACSRTLSGREEGFVAELDPSLSGAASLRSATYLGGGPASSVTYGGGIAVDGADHVYVTGYTTSPSFPATTAAFSPTLTDVDGTAFMAAFDFSSPSPGSPAPGSCASGGPGTSTPTATTTGAPASPTTTGTASPVPPAATPTGTTPPATAMGTPVLATATGTPAIAVPTPTSTSLPVPPTSSPVPPPATSTTPPVPASTTPPPLPPIATATPVLPTSTPAPAPPTSTTTAPLPSASPALVTATTPSPATAAATPLLPTSAPAPTPARRSPPRLQPAIALRPSTARPGTLITVRGSGFAPREQITLALNGEALTTTPAAILTTAGGRFRATFVAPSSLLRGANTVSALGTVSRHPALATLTGLLPVAVRFYLAGGLQSRTEHAALALLNPAIRPARVQLTLYFTDGSTARDTLSVGHSSTLLVPLTRLTHRLGAFGLALSANQSALAAQLILSRDGQDGDSLLPNSGPATRWYLAEGYTNLTFHETVAILNPDPRLPARVTLQLLPLGGRRGRSVTLRVAAHSERVVDINRLLPRQALSVIASADRGVVVERTLTFSTRGYGLTTRAGTTVAATSWLVANGATTGGVQTFLTVLNPGTRRARVTARFYGARGRLLGQTSLVVPGRSRATVRLNALVHARDVASLLTSDAPVVVERPEYAGSPNGRQVAGSDVYGRNGPGVAWRFTGGGLHGERAEMVLYNPSTARVPVALTFYGNGRTLGQRMVLAPSARAALDLTGTARIMGALPGVVVRALSTQGIVAEETVSTPGNRTLRSTQGLAQ